MRQLSSTMQTSLVLRIIHEYKWIAKIIIVKDHHPEDFPAASATSCICWVRLFVRSICFCKDLGTVTLVSAIVGEDVRNGHT